MSVAVETIQGEQLVYGFAVRNGRDSGWKIVASSLLSDPTLEHSLIARTYVGLRTSNTFGGGYGYFGDVAWRNEPWAVLCRYTRSALREATGAHFVQRNIVLLPFAEFIRSAGGHGLAFVEGLPSGGEYTNVEGIDVAPKVTLEARNLAAAKVTLEAPTLRRLLPAMLHDAPLIVVWPEPSIDQLAALLEILPANLRAKVTWCTCVADVKTSGSARLRIVKDIQVEQAATVFRFPQGDFFQERAPAGFAATLVDILLAARTMGPDRLLDLHRYIDSSTASALWEKNLLERAERAAVRWSRRQRIDKHDWAAAAIEHAEALSAEADRGVVDAEREWLIGQTTALMNPNTDRSRYEHVIRLLRPGVGDLTVAAHTAAERLRRGNVPDIHAFVASFRMAFVRDADDVIEQMLMRLGDTLDPEVRHWELILQLAGKLNIPVGLRRTALAHWTFANRPEWTQIRALFDFVHPSELESVERNSELLEQITADERGRLAFELLREGEGSEKFPASAREVHSDAILDVLAKGPSKNFNLRPYLFLRLLAEARKEPKAFTSSASKAIVDSFIVAYSDEEYLRLTENERTKIREAGKDVVEKHVPEKLGVFELANSRRVLENNAEKLSEAAVALMKAYKSQRIQSADLEQALAKASPPVAWYVYSALYELPGFDIRGFLCSLTATSQISATRAARMFLAVATAPRPKPQTRERLVETVDACAKTIARIQSSDDSLRLTLQVWTPKEPAEIDAVMAALTLFWGIKPAEPQRRVFDSQLPLPARFRLFTQRLRDLFGDLNFVGASPLYSVEKDLTKAETRDLSALRGVFLDALKYLASGPLKKPELVKSIEVAITTLDNAISDRSSDR